MSRQPQFITSRNIVTIDGSRGDTFFVDMESTVQQVKIINIRPGHTYMFLFLQNNRGGHVWPWPVNCQNAVPVNRAPHSRTTQSFTGNANNTLQANAPGGWQ